MPPTAVGPTIWGAPGRFSSPRPSMAVLIPPLLTSQQLLLIWHLGNARHLGPSGSKRGLGRWSFLLRMTHIRNRAWPGVSGKGPAPAWLRPRAEVGGKCLEQGGGPLAHRLSQAGRDDRKSPPQGPRMHHVERSQKAWVLACFSH